MLAGGDEEVAGAVGDDARAVVVGGRRGRVLDEDVLHVGEGGAVLGEAAAGGGGGGGAAAHGLGVGPVEGAVLGEGRRDGDVEEAALALGDDLGEAGDRRGDAAVGGDDAEAAGALGDEVAAVGEERDAPGVLEGLGDGLDGELEARARAPGRGSARGRRG